MKDKMIRVRGVHLIYEGRGYHDEEVELPEGAARHYINLGKAVEVTADGVQTPAPPVQPEPKSADKPSV